MKTTIRLINDLGVVTIPEPYKDTPVELVSVTFLPNIGDPEDPEDVDEIQLTYRLLGPNNE